MDRELFGVFIEPAQLGATDCLQKNKPDDQASLWQRGVMNFVTVSRQMGTKGTEVAKLVADGLAFGFYDTDSIEKKAAEMGLLNGAKAADDRARAALKGVLSDQSHASIDRLYAVVYELARAGNGVILGRCGNILFRSFSYALHVRIVASVEKRVHNLVERGYARREALAAIKKSDDERAQFIEFAFNREWDKSEFYDLVLNMDKFSVETAADIIITASISKGFEAHPADRKSSLMFHLAVKVRAALAKAGFSPRRIFAFVSVPGTVRLEGVVQTSQERSAAECVARGIEGVESVENKIEATSG